MQKGKIIEMSVNDFRKLGYDVDYKLVNSANYGVPQQRERVIIIGNRLGFHNGLPEPTHGTKKEPHITVNEVVGHLKDLWISYP